MRINKQMLLPAVTNAAVAAFAGFQGDTEFAILLGAVAAFCGLKCFGKGVICYPQGEVKTLWCKSFVKVFVTSKDRTRIMSQYLFLPIFYFARVSEGIENCYGF